MIGCEKREEAEARWKKDGIPVGFVIKGNYIPLVFMRTPGTGDRLAADESG